MTCKAVEELWARCVLTLLGLAGISGQFHFKGELMPFPSSVLWSSPFVFAVGNNRFRSILCKFFRERGEGEKKKVIFVLFSLRGSEE